MIAGERGGHAKTNINIPAVPGLQAVTAADEGGAKGEGEGETAEDKDQPCGPSPCQCIPRVIDRFRDERSIIHGYRLEACIIKIATLYRRRRTGGLRLAIPKEGAPCSQCTPPDPIHHFKPVLNRIFHRKTAPGTTPERQGSGGGRRGKIIAERYGYRNHGRAGRCDNFCR